MMPPKNEMIVVTSRWQTRFLLVVLFLFLIVEVTNARVDRAATASTGTAFVQPLHRRSIVNQQQEQGRRIVRPFLPTSSSLSSPLSTTSSSSTTLHMTFRLKPLSDKRRQKIRDKIEQEENSDFLFVEPRPKVLVHERDFFRQDVRVQAWDQYVLVSILCTSISYNALDNFQLSTDHEGIYFYEVILKALIQIVAGFAVLSGLYSTMVFSICILYGKSALGLERDVQYDKFLETTSDIRVNAFRAFSAALAFFAILVVLVLSEDLPLIMHIPIGSIFIISLYLGFRDWKRLVDAAGDIFNDDEEEF